MIPLSRPYITRHERRAVQRVLQSGTLSRGKYVNWFERAVADFCGTRYAVAVSSGTAGLQLCLHVMDLPRGGEVITTPFTFIASYNVLLHAGLEPVFVEIERNTLNINPDKIEDAITDKTVAIMPVHVFGLPCDMHKINAIAQKHKLAVLEDGCEALGASWSVHNPCVFAFYPNKQITTGEGGVIVTNDSRAAQHYRELRNHGRRGRVLIRSRPGFNYRLDEMSAALGYTQMQRIDKIISMRRQRVQWYNEELRNVSGITPMPYFHNRSPFVYYIMVHDSLHRSRILCNQEFQTASYFPPLKGQPYTWPHTQIVQLPFYSTIKRRTIKKICSLINK